MTWEKQPDGNIRLRDPENIENRINAGVTALLMANLRTWKCFEISDDPEFYPAFTYEFKIFIIGIPTSSFRVDVTVGNAQIVLTPRFISNLQPSNIGLHDPNYKMEFRNELKKYIYAYTHRMHKNLELIEKAVLNAG